jgi:hypothetical protein
MDGLDRGESEWTDDYRSSPATPQANPNQSVTTLEQCTNPSKLDYLQALLHFLYEKVMLPNLQFIPETQNLGGKVLVPATQQTQKCSEGILGRLSLVIGSIVEA